MVNCTILNVKRAFIWRKLNVFMSNICQSIRKVKKIYYYSSCADNKTVYVVKWPVVRMPELFRTLTINYGMEYNGGTFALFYIRQKNIPFGIRFFLYIYLFLFFYINIKQSVEIKCPNKV